MILSIPRVAAAALLIAPLAACSGGDENLGDPVPTVKLSYYSSDYGAPYERSARVIADELGELGIEVKLNPMNFNTFVDQITLGGKLDGMAYGGIGGDPNRIDPNFWISDLSSCEGYLNVTKWCSEKYDALATQQSKTLDEDERADLIAQAQEVFEEEAPWWMISHERKGVIWNNDRWGGPTSSAPVPPTETTLDPWLDIAPTGSDRVLDWAHLEDVSSYNPLTEYTGRGWIRMMYDTFLAIDEGELVPWAAEEYSFVDDTTLELTLREGMTFHDGRPVTAEDAVYSINLVRETKPAGLSDAAAPIKEVEQVDRLTFRITLNEPSPGFPAQSMTDLIILPKHIWENVKNPLEYDPVPDNAVIGSGPFKFVSWKPSVSHELATYTPHFAAPDYDGIRRLNLGQSDAVRAALEDDTADLATDVLPAEAMQRLAEESGSLDFMTVDTMNTTTLWMNHSQEPFGDPTFRRALRLATNPERVVNEGWLGFAKPAAASNIPSVLDEWIPEDLISYDYDIEAAREMLEEAGYGWDDDGRLHMPKDSPAESN